MDLIQLAKRQEDSIPGARLICFFEKWFPVYQIELRLRVQDPGEVQIISWFLLRLIDEGIYQLDQMAMFLGIPQQTAQSGLRELEMLGYIVVVPTLTSRLYKLTDRGRGVLEENRIVKQREEHFTVKLDATTGAVHHYFSVDTVSPGKRLFGDDEVIRPYLPFPSSLADVAHRLPDIRRVYKEFRLTKVGESGQVTLDEIVEVDAVSTHYRKLRLLVFLTDDQTYRFQVFDRDQLLPEYEEPLLRMAEAGMDIWQMEEQPHGLFKEDEFAASLTFPQMPEPLSGTDSHEAILPTSHHQQVRQEDGRSPVGAAAPREVEVTPLTTTDHFAVMQQSFALGRERVIIISPWVAKAVVRELLPDMEAFLQRKGELWIGYGYTNEDERRRKQTEDAIAYLKKQLPYATFFPVLLGNTHQKILICDSDYVVVGSYNWLSFRGDRKRGFVAETSVMIRNREVVQQYAKMVQRQLNQGRG